MPDTQPPPAPAAPSASARAFLALAPDLRRVARRLTRSAADADDLVQETLLRVWARLAMAEQGHPEAAPVTDLRAYAFATLRNRATNAAPGPATDPERRRPSDAQIPQPMARPARLPSRRLRALSRLPEDQRHLLRLRAFDGLSYAEIAAETGLPMGTLFNLRACPRGWSAGAARGPRPAGDTHAHSDLFPPRGGAGCVFAGPRDCGLCARRKGRGREHSGVSRSSGARPMPEDPAPRHLPIVLAPIEARRMACPMRITLSTHRHHRRPENSRMPRDDMGGHHPTVGAELPRAGRCLSP